MWKPSQPNPQDVTKLKAARHKYDLTPLVIHVNYLVNLAAADAVIRAKSVAAFRGELERAETIGADYLVVHPGSYKGRTREEGIEAVAQGIQDAHAGMSNPKVTVLLENTVGAGAQLGGNLEELKAIAGKTPLRVGYCLDTCHLLGAGFPIHTPAGLEDTVRHIDRVLGLRDVCIFHANDSKAPLGARLDRHEHIGEGYIGMKGFRRILTHPELRSKPFILETPVDEEGDDRRNLDTLKKLCPKSRTTITRSS
jgi:deoxyribonuclease-4